MSSQFVRLLDERLREVGENEYNDLSSMIPRLYRMLDSDSAWEEFYSIGDVPDIPAFNGQLQYLSVAPGYLTKIEPKEFAGGIMHERKLIAKKKYSVMDDRTGGLMRSAHRVREKYGVKPFANAFSTAFDFMTSEEGVSLCSSSHTTKTGTSTSSGFDNSGTSAMSKTSVAAQRLLMRGFRSDISERIEPSDDYAIICPDNIADLANEINLTPSGYDTAASDKNMQFQRYEIIPYLRLDDTDTKSWFMVDKKAMKRDLIWIDGTLPDMANTVDFETFMLKTSVYFEIANGFKNWRFIAGNQVT